MYPTPTILMSLCVTGSILCQEHAKSPSTTEPTTLEALASATADEVIPLEDLAQRKKELWEKYRREQKVDPARQKEHAEKKIHFGGLTMRFSSKTIGAKPKNGYPLYIALHGGGGAPARVNDGQWQHMKVYYRSSVKHGVYVATRGMLNTSQLHSVPQAFPAYDRLIENMILFADVDPNRVYVLGFSAGGDGTYQITPRMADRLAGAAMSAGHPNGVSMANLYHVPFLIQVGENDRAYNRHQVSAQYHVKFEELRTANPDGYVHQTNIHFGRPHNFRDNDPRMPALAVLQDPRGWLLEGNRATVKRNTNSIAWLDGFTRTPVPTRVIWDTSTHAATRASADLAPTANRGKLHYWLDLSGRDFAKWPKGLTVVRIDAANNAIVVEKSGDYLRVLLNNDMLDLSKPVTVQVDGRKLQVNVKARLRNLLQTLVDRGDPNYMFEAAVTIEKKSSGWAVKGT